MLFVMQRDRVVASVHGHSIEFKKGVPTYVPAQLHAEVMALGAEPTETMASDPRHPEPPKLPDEPSDPAKRSEEILAAIEMLATRNAREDFAASGAPHVKALAQILGWKPATQERDLLWAKFQVDGKED